jgi:LPXTG-motif cell wall-anchored protein
MLAGAPARGSFPLETGAIPTASAEVLRFLEANALRRALLIFLLANSWAVDVRATPVTTPDDKAIIGSQGQAANAVGSLRTAQTEKLALFSTLGDPEPALLGILSLGFAGLLAIRRRRD